MPYIGNAPGVGQRSVFRFVALAGQNLFAGRDAYGLVLGYTPGFADVFVNGRLLSPPDYIATDGSSITITRTLSADDEMMVLALNTFSAADTYGRAEAQSTFTRKRNRLINPGMKVSQEFGTAQTVVASGDVIHPIDGFLVNHVSKGAVRFQQVAVATPGGSTHRLRGTIVTADTNLESSAQLFIAQRVEGREIADLFTGNTSAKPTVLRFGFRGPAGTYSASMRGAGVNRSWVGTFVVASGEANQDIVRSFQIPADQTIAYPSAETAGLTVAVALMAGTTNTGVTGYQAGNYVAAAGQTNGMAVANATFDLFDIAFYEGPLVLPFELLRFEDDLRQSQRYFCWPQGWAGAVGETVKEFTFVTGRFPVIMRATPTFVFYSGQTNNMQRPGVAQITISSLNSSNHDAEGGTLYLNIPTQPDFKLPVVLNAGQRTIAANVRL